MQAYTERTKAGSWALYSREQNGLHRCSTHLSQLRHQNTSVPGFSLHWVSLRQVWPQKDSLNLHGWQYPLRPGVRVKIHFQGVDTDLLVPIVGYGVQLSHRTCCRV
jgi:hypothetical protein